MHDVIRRYGTRLNVVEQLIVALSDNRKRYVVSAADLRMMLDLPTDNAVGSAPDVQRVRENDRLFQIARFVDPMRPRKLAIAVECKRGRGDFVVPRIGGGQNRGGARTNRTAFDFCQIRDHDTGDIGNTVQWSGLVKSEVKRYRGGHSRSAGKREQAAYDKKGTSHRPPH